MLVHVKKKNVFKLTCFIVLTILVLKSIHLMWDNYCPYQSQLDLKANEALCIVTKQTEILRQNKNTITLDPSQLILDDFLEIIVDLPYFCQGIKSLPSESYNSAKEHHKLLIVLVESSRANFYERQLIRKTWGSIKSFKNWHIRILFLMGQSPRCIFPGSICPSSRSSLQQEESLLKREHDLFQDTVIGAFADTYGNLTYKTLMGYNFILRRCSQADFIVKVDDDVFLDIPEILTLRDSDVSTEGTTQVPDLYCRYVRNAEPVRCRFCEYGKYFISSEDWPGDRYPDYCIGGGYAISKDWVEKLYSVRGKGGFFRMEDIFTTGMLREIAEKSFGVRANVRDITANISITGQVGLYREDCKEGNIHGTERRFGMFVFVPRDDNDFERNMKCLWEKSLQSI